MHAQQRREVQVLSPIWRAPDGDESLIVNSFLA